MAGFRKATAEQAALKVGVYGPTGSGKTMTTLLCLEGLAKLTGKRFAFVDTERGTDFYCKPVAERLVHPDAFDFDALYTRSIFDVRDAVVGLDPAVYCGVAVDSITHLWESAKAAYEGQMTKIGTVPLRAWGGIKKPYKELVALLMSSPLHVFFCGRQGALWKTDEASGELEQVGLKMKAEGETPYEPHILFRLDPLRNPADGSVTLTCFAEKDRTGKLAGKRFRLDAEPGCTFDALVRPLLPLLGGVQAVMDSEEAAGVRDAERSAGDEAAREAASGSLLKNFLARFQLAVSSSGLEAIGKEITPELKKGMVSADVAALRQAFLAARDSFKP